MRLSPFILGYPHLSPTSLFIFLHPLNQRPNFFLYPPPLFQPLPICLKRFNLSVGGWRRESRRRIISDFDQVHKESQPCRYFDSSVFKFLYWFWLYPTRAKMRGFYKGVKYISQIFVVKERELDFEIGYPTDVKHVAHIGADGLGGAPPCWMNEFIAGPDFSAPTLGSFKEKKSHNSKESTGLACKVDSPAAQKKHKRRKSKSTTSSPRATSRSSRTSRSKEMVNVEAAIGIREMHSISGGPEH